MSSGGRRCAVPLPAMRSELLRSGGRDRDRHCGRRRAVRLVAGQCVGALGGTDWEPAPVVVARRFGLDERRLLREALVLRVTTTAGRSCSPSAGARGPRDAPGWRSTACGSCTRASGSVEQRFGPRQGLVERQVEQGQDRHLSVFCRFSRIRS